MDFVNPPANDACRNEEIANPRRLALACWRWDGFNRIYEWGISFNIRTDRIQGEWTSDLNSTDRFIVQAVSTHEVGHTIGLGHVPSSGTFADGGALLTMYPDYYLGQTNNGFYTLGTGDRYGYREVRP